MYSRAVGRDVRETSGCGSSLQSYVEQRQDNQYRGRSVYLVYTSPNQAMTKGCLYSGSLPFLYLSRPVTQLRLPFLFHNQRAAWAYVDIAWCSNQRMRFYRHRRGRSYSYATQAITNSNGLPFDPFYTATLIALAQKARSIHRGNEPLKVYSQWACMSLANSFVAGIPLCRRPQARRLGSAATTNHILTSVHRDHSAELLTKVR